MKWRSHSLNRISNLNSLRNSAEATSLSIIPNGSLQYLRRNSKKPRHDAVTAGAGVEITTITDDRFLGEVLKALLNRLKDEVFTNDDSLAAAIREVLDTVSHGQTLFGRIKQGGLGAQAYRRARFLKTGSDTYVINWARTFIKEFYPATLSNARTLTRWFTINGQP